MKKVIIILSFIVISLLSIFVVLKISNKNTFSFTTFKRQYSNICYQDEPQYLEVLIYVNNKNTSFTKKELVNQSLICDNDMNNVMELNIDSVIDRNYKQKIYNDNYYLYSYLFQINSKTNDDFEFEISDAYIYLAYENNSFKIPIGSYYFYKIPTFENKNNISISKLKPIVTKLDNNQTLSGIGIEYNNRSGKQIKIKNIKFLKSGIKASLKDVKELNKEYNSSDSIFDLVGYEYNILIDNFYVDNKTINLIINNNEKKEFIIPLKYEKKYPINSLAFIVEYELDNTLYKYYFDEFTFFKTNQSVFPENEVNVYTYDLY